MFKKVLSVIFLILPLILVFRYLFAGSLAWGDSPYLFAEEAKEYFSEPLAWTARGNNFGGASLVLWLSPIMFLWGALAKLGLGSNLIIILLFYLPSLFLAAAGMYLLTRYLKLSKVTQFFSVLIYLLNTYYLLLIDGGQGGVALAYGLFPLTLLFLKKLIDKPSLNSFFLSLLFLVLCSLADPRVALIAVATIIIWNIFSKNLIFLFPLGPAWLAVNAYWLYPLWKNGGLTAAVSSPNLSFVKLTNSLLLFSPHWPANIFGKVNSPPFYFVGIPLLILIGLILNKDKKNLALAFCFFVFAFLATIPIGTIFRDSSKFFIPVVLFGGILIGNTLSLVKGWWFKVAGFVYLLFLVWPAISGKMNFVLSARSHSPDLQKIYQNLNQDNSFFRSLWFPERHPLTFAIAEKPALDAAALVNSWPFANLNAGEDVFNFLNNSAYVGWFKILGIKYLILSDNQRVISKSKEETKDWQTIKTLVSESKDLQRLDWQTSIPVYRVAETYPHFYRLDKLVAVVGPMLSGDLQTLPAVYFEDGKLNPQDLEGLDPGSVDLYFNSRDKDDLALSFLQPYFYSAKQAKKSDWANYDSSQYLKYKYELLIRGINFSDFDYQKGISFSTNKGEKMEFSFDVPKSGEYLLVVRNLIPENKESFLNWKILENKNLSKGVYKYTFTNNFNLQVFNVIALVPKGKREEAQKLADTFISHFKAIDEKDLTGFPSEYQEIEINKWGTLKYKLANPNKTGWIIFSDNYHPLWKLRKGNEYFSSVPAYSLVNGFYVNKGWGDLGIEFKGQDYFRWGVWLSTISVLLLLICRIYFSKLKI